MPEKTTVKVLKNLNDGVIVCQHLLEAENTSVGFNVPDDIYTDFQAWCDECEKILIKEGGWTEKAAKFANFKTFCLDCFLSYRNEHIKKNGA